MADTEKKFAEVPYFIFEAVQARTDRKDRRQTVAIIGLSAALTITNAVWAFLWNRKSK